MKQMTIVVAVLAMAAFAAACGYQKPASEAECRAACAKWAELSALEQFAGSVEPGGEIDDTLKLVMDDLLAGREELLKRVDESCIDAGKNPELSKWVVGQKFYAEAKKEGVEDMYAATMKHVTERRDALVAEAQKARKARLEAFQTQAQGVVPECVRVCRRDELSDYMTSCRKSAKTLQDYLLCGDTKNNPQHLPEPNEMVVPPDAAAQAKPAVVEPAKEAAPPAEAPKAAAPEPDAAQAEPAKEAAPPEGTPKAE